MGKPNFSDGFKRDAVAQITEWGYALAEVSQRLPGSTHCLYAWTRQLAKVVRRYPQVIVLSRRVAEPPVLCSQRIQPDACISVFEPSRHKASRLWGTHVGQVADALL
ncbi:transposase [Komagataeibacter sp. FXV3]|nr:transposase [Komagataeibacter sp. FXV3]